MQGDLHGTVGVLGYGVDGQAVTQFLWKKTQYICVCRGATCGAQCVCSGARRSGRPGLERIVVFDDASSEFRLPTSNVVIDKLTTLGNVDLLFRSPGFPLTHPLVVAAKEKGIPITSSTTHFLQHFPGVTVGVTGSNGKTTCVALITGMLKAEYGDKRVERGGNDGVPRLDLLTTNYSLPTTHYTVLELSSFQLIDCPASPNVSVVLNITPNHLNWHASMEEYIEAKRQIVAHQEKGDIAVLSASDPIVRAFAKSLRRVDIRFFTNCQLPTANCRFKTHPDTVRAAVTAARALNVSENNIIRVLQTFPGVPHRLEFVRELDGVKWYNDSSSTTPESAIVACDSFPQGTVVLLLGGRDKGMDFSKLYEVIRERAVRVIPYGEMATTFATNIPTHYPLPTTHSFEDVIKTARSSAHPGDTIVLSPACASFDMFTDAKERGSRFAECVQGLSHLEISKW